MSPDHGPLASGSPDAKSTPSRRPGNGQPRLKRPREETTDEEKRASMLRQVNSYSNRIQSSGLQALADAVALREALDTVIDAGVETCRAEPWSASWAEIGTATGLSRSAAQERWGALGGARKPGGQPGALR